jgi:hypothetical protein
MRTWSSSAALFTTCLDLDSDFLRWGCQSDSHWRRGAATGRANIKGAEIERKVGDTLVASWEQSGKQGSLLEWAQLLFTA